MAEPMIDALLTEARRRRRHRRVLLGATTGLGVGAGVTAALAGAAHVWFLSWGEPGGWLLTAVLASVGAAAGWMRRQTDLGVAQAVDAALDGRDRLTTAVELRAQGSLAVMERRQVDAAEQWAERRDLSGMGSILPPRPVIRLVAGAVLGAAVLTFTPSLTDAMGDQRRVEVAAIATEAERLEELAETAPEPIAEQLTDLATDLRQLDTSAEAIERLRAAQEELAEAMEPSDLAQRTALAGLQQRLEQAGMSEGGAASEALAAMAAAHPSMSTSEIVQTAAELHDRADDFAGVSPEVADALAAAANALDAQVAGLGDAGSASDALAAAADAVASAEAAAAEAAAAAQGSAAAAEAADRLEEGQGQGQGQG
ncbi:MAG: hypothetical protein ACFCVC_03555, partial [Acidimicrobiia bacterium]